jgi:hypothetical protein
MLLFAVIPLIFSQLIVIFSKSVLAPDVLPLLFVTLVRGISLVDFVKPAFLIRRRASNINSVSLC